MQSKIFGRKNASYLGFLQAIGEEDLPSFSTRQEKFIKWWRMFTAIIKQRVEIFVDTGIDSVVCFLKTVIE